MGNSRGSFAHVISRLGWPIFILSAAAELLGALSQQHVEVFWPGESFSFFDLGIYRESAGVLLAGHPLYRAHFQYGFGFTYPPFTALVMVALRVLPVGVDELGVSLVNLGLVVALTRAALELSGRWNAGDVEASRRELWLLAGLAMWCEPVISAIGYGQIDLLIAALVIADLTWGRSRPWGGAGVGLAAGLKLTPLVFIPYLLLSGRRRMAATALGSFGATVGLSFVCEPGDAAGYWGSAVFHTSRVSGGGPLAGRAVVDQSVHGLVLRLDPALGARPDLWLLSCGVVGAAGLWSAVRAARRGDEFLGYLLCAVVGLLVCPISWTHHWVIALPGLLLALRAPAGRRRWLAGLAALVAGLGSSAIWLTVTADPSGRRLGVGGILSGDPYVLAGLGLIGVAGGLELARMCRRLSREASRGYPGARIRALPTGPLTPGHRQSAT